MMSRFFVLFFAIYVLRATAINVTNSGNPQEITDMKHDISLLWNLVTGMNNTIQAQQQELAYLTGTTQRQQQKIALMDSTTQQDLRILNATIYAQQQKEKSMNKTIQDQQHKITLLESTIQLLKKENQTIHDEIKFLSENSTAEIESLKEMGEKGNQNYEAVQIVVHDLVTNVNTLRNTSQLQIGHINGNLTSLARQIHYTSLSFLDAQKMLKDFENITKETKRSMSSVLNKLSSQGLDHLQSEGNRTIGFTVSSSSTLINYNGKIIYDKVITNIGTAYDSNTGIFTCPTPGTYVFTWSTMSASNSQHCYTYIFHNGNPLLLSQSVEQNGGSYEVASNTILLKLTVGDRVWIDASSGVYCFGYPFTAFSGWKI